MTLTVPPTGRDVPDLASATWVPVCAATDLLLGQVLAVTVGGRSVAVARTCDGELFAVADHDPQADPGGRHADHGAVSSGRLGTAATARSSRRAPGGCSTCTPAAAWARGPHWRPSACGR